MNINDFFKRKDSGEKISMVTSYDYWSAKLISKTDIDTILVGDSLAMVMHGHDTTIPATPELMALHTKAVAKGAPNKFIVGDMPFLSFRQGKKKAIEAVSMLMKAGANCVKLEGVDGHEKVISHIVESGVPVMGHLGLTPQSVHKLGGYKVQGKEEKQIKHLMNQAKSLESLGCFSIVLECIPAHVAKAITEELSIPTIGIGAGIDVDGQVLVLHDLLGLNEDFNPRFVRQFLKGASSIKEALNSYHDEVTKRSFPNNKECF
jgi:3-methyl-2-oxobutanoate hydroxymethyltransferase